MFSIADSIAPVRPAYTRNRSMILDLEQVDELTLTHRHNEQVTSRPFVHPLGGTRAFASSKAHPKYDEKLPPSLGRNPCFTWQELFDLNGFRDIELWKQALLEGFATCLLVWLSSLVGYALSSRIV
jgi:hypothetical protein